MLRVLPLALGDLGDRTVQRVLVLSLLITLALFAILGVVLGRALAGADPCGLVGLDACPLDPGAGAFSAVMLTVLGIWLLFPAVAIGVVGSFSERVIAAVEARHYPAALATARHPGQLEIAWLGLRAGLRLLAYNVVALPFYLLLLVTGIGPLVLFLFVNAIAVGRDLWEMVAVRHDLAPYQPAPQPGLPDYPVGGRVGERAGAAPGSAKLRWERARRGLLASTRGDRFLLGLAVTGLFMIPLVNLLAPVLGAAMAAHLFHGRVE
ncbi:MAG: EI24 domain-containing protein [Sphingomonadaceae bacterium]|nr:EI24 domain-containing protein [Sphingomonadaceae bacterium]